MIEHNGKNYYSLTEIANGFNADDETFREVHKSFSKCYDRPVSKFVSDAYLQSKVYPATKRKLVKHIKYSRKSNKRIYYGYALDDLIEFFNTPIAKHVQAMDWIVLEDNTKTEA